MTGNKHERLDKIVVTFFKKLEDLSALRRQLDQEMRDGFLLMAKARSNMGQKTVSSSQYDEREIIPNYRVEHDHKCLSFGLIKNMVPKVEKEDRSSEVRKRNIETVGGQDGDVPKQKSTNTDKAAELVEPKDPLLMFGLLVPQSLRLSKACFQRCVTVSTKIVETQAEIMAMKTEYQELLSN